MAKISNRRVGYHVQHQLLFSTHTGSMYSHKVGEKGYAVYSYGPHWPLAFWDGSFWLVNTERSSVTTNRHCTICRQSCPSFVGVGKKELEYAIKRASVPATSDV